MASPSPSNKDVESKGGSNVPWVELYRPMVLDDVVGNMDAVSRLKVIAHNGNMPNLVIAGPPGTGKTTSIHCLARQMLGNSYEDAVLEVNASDDRGIDVVRSRIKMFAQKKVTLPPGMHKMVILDEADSMAGSAQQALRRTMELYSNTTRFALACNISSKIIEPIQSRCAILRFTRLKDTDVLRRMKVVLDAEQISTWTEDGLKAILFTAEGDMRHALNNLQSTYSGLTNITAENVFKMVDQPHPLTINTVLRQCVKGYIKQAMIPLSELWEQGYAAIDIVGTMFRVAKHLDMDDRLKAVFIKEIGLTHTRIADGVSTHLQLNGLLARLCKLVTE